MFRHRLQIGINSFNIIVISNADYPSSDVKMQTKFHLRASTHQKDPLMTAIPPLIGPRSVYEGVISPQHLGVGNSLAFARQMRNAASDAALRRSACFVRLTASTIRKITYQIEFLFSIIQSNDRWAGKKRGGNLLRVARAGPRTMTSSG